MLRPYSFMRNKRASSRFTPADKGAREEIGFGSKKKLHEILQRLTTKRRIIKNMRSIAVRKGIVYRPKRSGSIRIINAEINELIDILGYKGKLSGKNINFVDSFFQDVLASFQDGSEETNPKRVRDNNEAAPTPIIKHGVENVGKLKSDISTEFRDKILAAADALSKEPENPEADEEFRSKMRARAQSLHEKLALLR